MTNQKKSKTTDSTSPIFQKLKIFSNSFKVRTKSDCFQNRNFDDELLLSCENSKLFEKKESAQILLNGYSKIQELKLVKIGLASSEKIVEWAEKALPNGKIFGEVLNANTLHYKTFKPHKGGLFCERIFGPLKDFECACGIKQRPLEEDGYAQNVFWGEAKSPPGAFEKQTKKNFCPNCDVEYTWSVIRRYQLGYIQLASPVSHLWYLRTSPSYLSLLLDIRKRDLESIIYCMQMTTLEYYWRPLHSLQMNVTASTLLSSYEKFLTFDAPRNVETISQKLYDERKLASFKTKKQEKELRKRKKIEINRSSALSGFHPVSDFSKSIKLISDNDPVEKKIEYLENSFKLNSESFSRDRILKKQRVNLFIKRRNDQTLKKQRFFKIYRQFFQDFYKKLYFIVSKRSVQSFPKIEFLKAEQRNESNKNAEKMLSCEKHQKKLPSKSGLFLFLKIYLSQTKHKKNKTVFLKTISEKPRYSFETLRFASLPFETKRLRSNFDLELTKKTENFLLNDDFQLDFHRKKIFFENFVDLLRKTQIYKIWPAIYQNQRYKWSNLSTFWGRTTELHPISNLSVHRGYLHFFEIFENALFLYLLCLIQENPKSFIDRMESDFKTIKTGARILSNIKFFRNYTLKTRLTLEKTLTFNAKHFNFQFWFEHVLGVRFSKAPPAKVLFDKHKKTLKFLEVKTTEEFFGDTNKQFVRFFHRWLTKLTASFLAIDCQTDHRSHFKNKKKLRETFFDVAEFKFGLQARLEASKENSSFEFLRFRDFIEPLKKKTKAILPEAFQKASKAFLYKQLYKEKKTIIFFKNSNVYSSNYLSYRKHFLNMSKKLIEINNPKSAFFSNLFNNIYTVGYCTGWQNERDWRYFLYYNTSPIEIFDQLLTNYKYRFLEAGFSSFEKSPSLPVIGAHFIQKLVFQYEGVELKKIAKQHQNLLPKLNRYIRYLKPSARKKSDFLQIQKLLQKRDSIIRRLKLLRKLWKKNTKPTSMILRTLPVLPPDLRPILKMQNQIAASDLNRFYQRIIYRNERFKKFLKTNSSMLQYEPGFELKYAQRLLQESVDNVIQNGKGNVKPETNSRGQPLKSLSEILKGKQGRFRQYLLGKRVDYSGRSVIVVGPTLKLSQCGLPYEMALELFLPFLIKRIFQYGFARTVIGAKTILKTQKKITWNLLEEVMQNHPILLNRAPTLHRLGIQAFQPKLIEGRAILLHPLVCPAFNADFDGDQMAVHLPVTVEARTEAWKLMFSRNHLISSATGEPMLLPSQDMVLGCYYLTTECLQSIKFHRGRPFISGTRFYFSNMTEVLQAYLQEKIHLQTPIWMKWNGLIEMDQHFSQPFEIRVNKTGFSIELQPRIQKHFDPEGVGQTFFIRTTAGRILLNTLIQNSVQNA